MFHFTVYFCALKKASWMTCFNIFFLFFLAEHWMGETEESVFTVKWLKQSFFYDICIYIQSSRATVLQSLALTHLPGHP